MYPDAGRKTGNDRKSTDERSVRTALVKHVIRPIKKALDIFPKPSKKNIVKKKWLVGTNKISYRHACPPLV